MALHRGIQSAIFYYLSCAPCAEARYRKNRKAEAERARQERLVLEVSMPHHYRQPSPSSTNPHWQTEIDAGPHLSARGKRRPTAAGNPSDSQRGLHATLSSTDSNGSHVPSDTDLPRRTHSRGSGATSNVDSAASDGVTPPQRAYTREKHSPQSYRSYRNPQVNDLHPAVVTKVESREEAAWLMEPPPIIDVMTGKDRAGRVRSDSNSSRPSTRSNNQSSLARQVSTRIVQRQLTAGASNTSLALTRETSIASRSGVPPFIPDEALPLPTSNPAELPPRDVEVSETSSQSAGTIIHRPSMAPEIVQPVQRPQLSTIVSESHLSATSTAPKENDEAPALPNQDQSSEQRDRIARRSGVIVRDNSFKMLQELAPHSEILNAQSYTSTSPTAESEIELPVADDEERRRLNSSGEGFDKWYTPDFQLDTWIHEHTKREVQQRWSMDI